MDAQSRQDVADLLERLRAAELEVEQFVRQGMADGERLRDSCRRVGESSSSSWCGWHSRMFYSNWEAPPVAETWNAEWGGLQRFSSAWRERSQEVVQSEIERRAGVTLSSPAGQ